MTRYHVYLSRSIECGVDVEADTPNAAADKASRNDFPLPPADEWNALKDWRLTVYEIDPSNGDHVGPLLELER